MDTLTKDLPLFLWEVEPIKLAFYNAGTDVFEADRLGGMKISAKAVVQRDRYVLEELVKRNIPTVVMTSGGYSGQSYEFIPEMARSALVLNDESVQ